MKVVRSSSLSRMPVEHELFWPTRMSFLSCSLLVEIGADHWGCSHIHILGSVQNIKIARDAVVSLILGSPPGMIIFVAFGRRHSLTENPRQGLRTSQGSRCEDEATFLEFIILLSAFGLFVQLFIRSACMACMYTLRFLVQRLFSAYTFHATQKD